MKFSVEQVLPADADQATLVGRAWVPGRNAGPSPVLVADAKAWDLSRVVPTVSELLNLQDPVKVALALEGMEFEVFDGGKGNMRKDDHQFFQPIYISSLGERTEKEPFDEEKTGWGWKLVAKIDTPATVLPTTCKMERPN